MTIPEDTTIQNLSINVRNLEVMKFFYEQIINFEIIEETKNSISFGAGNKVLLEVFERKDLNFLDPGNAGLYHFAILVPSQIELAKTVRNILQKMPQYFTGSADHLVSEAFYFEDPEGNGIEIYRDRPREEWQWLDNKVVMGSKYIDPFIYMAGAKSDQRTLHPDTLIGHIHLKVGDISEAKRFYVEKLGFEITAELDDSALFVSAGKYHHHIGLNTWESRGAGKRKEAFGLKVFAIKTNTEYLQKFKKINSELIKKEKEDSIEIEDPWGNEIILN